MRIGLTLVLPLLGNVPGGPKRASLPQNNTSSPDDWVHVKKETTHDSTLLHAGTSSRREKKPGKNTKSRIFKYGNYSRACSESFNDITVT